MAHLGALDPDDLSRDLASASAALDGVHMALLEREAHLQNLQDLAHLQQHKLTVLRHRRAELAAGVAPAPEPAPAATPPAASGSLVERREKVEDRFLEALQRRGDAPPPRPRRRRG